MWLYPSLYFCSSWAQVFSRPNECWGLMWVGFPDYRTDKDWAIKKETTALCIIPGSVCAIRCGFCISYALTIWLRVFNFIDSINFSREKRKGSNGKEREKRRLQERREWGREEQRSLPESSANRRSVTLRWPGPQCWPAFHGRLPLPEVGSFHCGL